VASGRESISNLSGGAESTRPKMDGRLLGKSRQGHCCQDHLRDIAQNEDEAHGRCRPLGRPRHPPHIRRRLVDVRDDPFEAIGEDVAGAGALGGFEVRGSAPGPARCASCAACRGMTMVRGTLTKQRGAT